MGNMKSNTINVYILQQVIAFLLAFLVVTATPLQFIVQAQTVTDTDSTRSGAVEINANRVPRNKTLNRATGDAIDYYTFTVTERKKLSFGVRYHYKNNPSDSKLRKNSNLCIEKNGHNYADTLATLEDSDGNQIAVSGAPAKAINDPCLSKGFSREWLQEIDDPGTYYLKVEAQEDGKTSYYLRFGLKAAPLPKTEDQAPPRSLQPQFNREDNTFTYSRERNAPRTAPTLTLKTSSDTGVSSSDNITKDSTPTFTISNVPSPAPTVTITAKKGGTTKEETITGNGDVTFSTLSDGEWLILARYTKFTPVFSNTVRVTVDTAAPTITVNAQEGTTISATMTDDNERANGFRYIRTTSTTCSSATITASTGTAYTEGTDITLAKTDNDRYLCFRAEDKAGNVAYRSSAQIDITILTPIDGGWSAWSAWSPAANTRCSGDTFTQTRTRTCTNPAPQHGGAQCVGESSQQRQATGTASCTAPTLTLKTSSDTGVSSSDNITKDSTPTFTISNVPSPAPTVTITAKKGGTTKEETITGNGDVTFSTLSDGEWLILARYTKFTPIYSNTVRVTVDTAAPTITVNAQEGTTISATMTDDNERANGFRYIRTTSTTCSSATITASTGTAYTEGTDITLTGADNDRYLCFRAEDKAGNVAYRSSAQIDITILTPIDGGWSAWSAWSPAANTRCSGDTFTQTRTRTCTNPAPQHGGAQCVGESSQQRQATGTASCTAPTLTLKTSSDTGVSSSDNITKDSTPTFTISNVPSPAPTVTITAKKGGTTKEETITGNGDVTFSTLSDGEWLILARYTKFTPIYSNTVRVTVDTAAPTITVNAQEGTTISATMTDDNERANGFRYIRTTSTTCSSATITASTGTAYTEGTDITLTGADNDRYLCFRAEDKAGNVAYRSSAQIDITILTPIDGGWSAWSAWSPAANTRCSGDTFTQTRTRTCTNPAPQHGGAQCVGESSQQRQATGTASCTAPTLTLKTSSDTGVSSSDNITKDSTPTFTISNVPSPAPTVTITAKKGGTTKEETITGNGDVTFSTLSDGEWLILARYTKFTPIYSNTVRVTVDTAAPTITVNAQEGTTISATMTDDNERANGFRYIRTTSTTCSSATITASTGTAYTEGTDITLAKTDNDRYLCFRAEDKAGNVAYRSSAQIDITILTPIDGGWSAWSAWSPAANTRCSGDTFTQTRTRTCTNPAPQHGGAQCVGESSQQRQATGTKDCSIDGGWSAWSAWSPAANTRCSGTTFTQTRTRTCTNPAPQNGGLQCIGDSFTSRSAIGTARCLIITITPLEKTPARTREATATVSGGSPTNLKWTRFNPATETCDSTLTFSNTYTSGTPVTIGNSESHNGMKACFTATKGTLTAYRASDGIQGIDRTPPELTIDTVADDDVIDNAEDESRVEITGTVSGADSPVMVTVIDEDGSPAITKTATVSKPITVLLDDMNIPLDEWDHLGISVATTADGSIIVGAPGDDEGHTDAGAVYIFKDTDADGDYDGAGEVTKISNATGNISLNEHSFFGSAVAVTSDDYIIVGAPGINTVYLLRDGNNDNDFADTGDGTDSVITIVRAGHALRKFGTAVSWSDTAVSGGKLVVGAPYDRVFNTQTEEEEEIGAVYIIQLEGKTLTGKRTYQVQQTCASSNCVSAEKIGKSTLTNELEDRDRFGSAVSVRYETVDSTHERQILAVGAPTDDTGGTDTGAVYLIERVIDTTDGSTGTPQEVKIASMSGHGIVLDENDHFGSAVALYTRSVDGDEILHLAVGTQYDDDRAQNIGAVYLFAKKSGSWSVVDKVGGYSTDIRSTPTDLFIRSNSYLGSSLAAVGTDSTEKLLVGAIGHGDYFATGGVYRIPSDLKVRRIWKTYLTSAQIKRFDHGTLTITARASDIAGNTGTAERGVEYTTGPSVRLKPSSDTGTSNHDKITGDNTPTVIVSSFTATDSITVTAAKSGETSVTATRTGNGEVTLGTLADGVWSITATNGTDTTPTLTVTIDTAAPSGSAALTNAAADEFINTHDRVTNDAIVSVTVTGGTAGISVRYAVLGSAATCDSTATVAETAAPTMASVTADGEYSICVKLTDTAGNTAYTATTNFVRDMIPPTITVGSVNTATDTITATVSSQVTNGWYVRKTTNTCGETDFTGSPTAYTFGTPVYLNIADNTKFLCFKSEDDGKNTDYAVSARITGVTTTVLINLDAGSDSGIRNNDGITNDDTPTFVISGYQATDSITVTATMAGESDVTAQLTGNGEVTLTTLAEGVWSVTATNGTLITPTLAVTIDTTDPAWGQWSFTLLNAAADDYINAEEVTDTGYVTTIPTITDATVITSITYAISDADSEDGCKGLEPGDYRVQRFRASDFKSREGEWEMCARATDTAGNVKNDIEAQNYITVDKVPPTITLSTLSISGDTAAITATIYDKWGRDSSSYRYVLVDSTAACTAAAFTGDAGESYTSGTALSITLKEVNNGEYLCFRAKDRAGNAGYKASAVISGVVDPPSINLKPESDTGGDSTDHNTADTTPTFVIAGFDSTDTVTVTAAHSGRVAVTAERTGNGEVTFAALRESVTNGYTITASDGNGTTVSLSPNLVIDTTSPVLVAQKQSPPNTNNEQEIRTILSTDVGTPSNDILRQYTIVSEKTDCDAAAFTGSGTLYAFPAGSGTTTHQLVATDSGKYFCFRAIDKAGNSTYTVIDQYIALRFPPPTVPDSIPQFESNNPLLRVIADTTPTVRVTGVAAHVPITVLAYVSDGVGVIATILSAADNTHTGERDIVLNTLSSGVHYQIVVTDGFSSSPSGSLGGHLHLYVDTDAPRISVRKGDNNRKSYIRGYNTGNRRCQNRTEGARFKIHLSESKGRLYCRRLQR